MLDIGRDFCQSLEPATRNLIIALRIEAGLDAEAHIAQGKDGSVLLFTTDYTDGKTLKHWLDPILSLAFKNHASPKNEEEICALDPSDHPYPDHDGRGIVKVALTPNVIGYLTARL